MFNKKEAISILLAAIVIGYTISFKTITWLGWISAAGLALIVLFVHHIGQKLTALFYDCSIEVNLWTVKQFWLAKKSYFKFNFPLWVVLPVLLVIFTFGFVKWLALTTFEAIPLPSRVRRKYAELTEWDLALITVGGLFFNALLAVISQIFGWNNFAMLNLYFILFNLIPISKLDGGKIFFGSIMLWIFSLVLTIVLILLLGTVSPITTIISAVLIAIIAVILFYISMHT
ncbi:MAG: hypothetical protein QW041_01195 [Candidatus Pacearchaeota archaeon]